MIPVEIWTDGMGSFRARCTVCEWVSVWFERAAKGHSPEKRAILAAQNHGLTHS